MEIPESKGKDAMASEIQVPHLQSDHEMPAAASPSPQVDLLTPLSEVAPRIRYMALSHYVQALVATLEDFFLEHRPAQGMDLCLAVALLPDGKSILRADLRPNALTPSGFTDFLARVQSLPRPPVRGGPVALRVQLLVAGGCQNRVGPCFRNDVPAGFARALQEAEAEYTPPPPGFWAKAMAGCRQVFLAVRNAVVPPAPAKPAPSESCEVAEEDRTLERLTELIENRPQGLDPYLWRARLYQKQQQFDAAIADYSEYLSRKPADAQALFERGVCFHRSGSREKALADYNEAAWRNPRAAVVLVQRAWLYVELGAVQRALQDAAAATEIDPEEPEWLLARAKILAAQGKFDLALADLDRVLQLDPHHVDSLFIRAMVYRDRPSPPDQAAADCQLAIAGFTSAIRLNRDHVPAYANRAQVRRQVGDLEGAMADCDQAIRRDAKFGFAYAIRGHVALGQGDRRKAVADCAEAIRLGTDGWLVQLTLADAHLGENELDEALTACDAALKFAPQHAGALFLRARVQMQMGLLDAAMEDASAAIGLAPAWNAPYALRGNLHGLRGDTANALADLDEALRLEPADAAARYNRGVAWFHQKEFARSLEDFNEAEKLGYRVAILYFMRATVQLQQCRPEQARVDLDEALRLDPEYAPALNTRANLFLRQGQHDAAMRDFNELIRLCPNVAAAYSSRAGAWLQLGEQEKAAQDFQEAVQLDPGHAEAYAIQGLLTEAAFHHNREDFQQAIARASEAIQADPACGPAYALRAAAFWYTEHHVEAVDDYDTLLEMEQQPSFAALSGRGQVYAEMGEFQSGLDDLDRAIELESQGVPPTILAYALSGRALARAGLGQFEEAERDFEASIRNCPVNAWVHYNHGLMYHQLGKPDAAVACFRLALELREPSLPPRKRDRARGYVRRYGKTDESPPDVPAAQERSTTAGKGIAERQAMNAAAQAAEVSGELGEGEAHVLDLLKLAPEDLASRRFVTLWALEKGKIALAKEQAAAALQIEASDTKKYGGSHLGRILCGLVGLWEKNWTEAESCFRKILSESPHDFVARNNIALALVEQDDPAKKQQAIDYAEANSFDGSKNPDVLSTLGWVRFRRGEFEQAEAALDRVAEMLGSKLDPDTATYVAHIRHHRGRDGEAKDILENALKSDRYFSMRPEALGLYEKVKHAAQR